MAMRSSEEFATEALQNNGQRAWILLGLAFMQAFKEIANEWFYQRRMYR